MKHNLMATVCRWTARIFGGVLVALVIVIAIGEGMPNPFTQPFNVQIGFLALAILLMGILAGWRWELAGGLLATAGWCLFVGSVVGARGLNAFICLLALPGVLYLLSAGLRTLTMTKDKFPRTQPNQK